MKKEIYFFGFHPLIEWLGKKIHLYIPSKTGHPLICFKNRFNPPPLNQSKSNSISVIYIKFSDGNVTIIESTTVIYISFTTTDQTYLIIAYYACKKKYILIIFIIIVIFVGSPIDFLYNHCTIT